MLIISQVFRVIKQKLVQINILAKYVLVTGSIWELCSSS